MSRTHSNTVISEAVRWFNRFRIKGPTALSPDESAEWARWVSKKEHLEAFQQTEHLWEELGQLTKSATPAQQDLDSDQYDPEHSVSGWISRKKPENPSR